MRLIIIRAAARVEVGAAAAVFTVGIGSASIDVTQACAPSFVASAPESAAQVAARDIQVSLSSSRVAARTARVANVWDANETARQHRPAQPDPSQEPMKGGIQA